MIATPVWVKSIQRETADNPGAHSRRDGWPVMEEHGRLQWSPTPRHLTAVPDFELSLEGVEARSLVKDARARARFWVLALLGALLAVAGLMMGGCASSGFPPPVESVTLPETFGGAISETFAKATGFRVRATTIPGLPTIVFGPQDRCITEDHEGAHRAQQRRDGNAEFTRRYLTEWWACMERLDSGWASFGPCSQGVSYEIEAYAVEAACRAKGATR
jgi:hypothetical protein